MINLEWVADYIDISKEDLKELAIKITTAGINVEKVITNHIDHLVIGQIKSCKPHPDSDHLHVCEVSIGNELTQIVCGATNVRTDLKVIVALPGAVLPNDFEIKKSVIRGVESNGMLCALYELGLEEKTVETYAKGIYEVDSDAPLGVDALHYLGKDDTIYELDIHKHRNNDCYYHLGFAYEIASIINKKVTLPASNYQEIEDDIENYFSLKVETEKCPYYLAKMVSGIEIHESPEFIKRRLESAGMRSINNVVDISNYVMLEYGQPMHFFDKDKLGNKIVVRDAFENEEITTLDAKLRSLKSSDIVITDGIKPVCIAGVMGGANTDVDNSTKNILIESAIFDAVSIRNTASNLNLKSEASIRYGKGLNYEYTEEALNRACYLLEKYAKAKVLKGLVKYDTLDKTLKTVTFTAQDINQMLGIIIDPKDMEIELNRLDFPYIFKNNVFTVTIPRRRLDIEANVNDIAEEIGRLYGYQNLKSTLPSIPIKKGEYIGDVKYRKFLSKRLRALGLNETKTYTLTSSSMASSFNYEKKEPIILPNPMSMDKSVIRMSVLPSLCNVYLYNKARNVNDVLLYEISKTYDCTLEEDTKISLLLKGNYLQNQWSHETIKVDFYLVKGIVEDLLQSLGLKNRYIFQKEMINGLHPGISATILLGHIPVGVIGRVHPSILSDEVYVAELSLPKLMVPTKNIKYKEALKYPTIEKDFAFAVKKEVSGQAILEVIKKSGGRLLLRTDIFDVYEGDKVNQDEKSIAFHLVFGDESRTLTDEEVMKQFNLIIEAVSTKLNAKLRDK